MKPCFISVVSAEQVTESEITQFISPPIYRADIWLFYNISRCYANIKVRSDRTRWKRMHQMAAVSQLNNFLILPHSDSTNESINQSLFV